MKIDFLYHIFYFEVLKKIPRWWTSMNSQSVIVNFRWFLIKSKEDGVTTCELRQKKNLSIEKPEPIGKKFVGSPIDKLSDEYNDLRKFIGKQIEQKRTIKYWLHSYTDIRKLLYNKIANFRMMLFMVFCFILCWSPINMLNLYRDFINIHTPKWFNIVSFG